MIGNHGFYYNACMHLAVMHACMHQLGSLKGKYALSIIAVRYRARIIDPRVLMILALR